MSNFNSFQYLKRGQSATPPLSFARPVRPFAPLPSPSSQNAHRDLRASLDHVARLGHSFDRISLLPSEKRSDTGLPDTLKAGVETLSGLSMDDVKVHYNSSRPSQVQALAYTQGTDIHVGPGQERHLAHEAWHVVQQMQGRVKPTLQAKGVAINDDQGLEREADEMGERARIVGATEVQRKKVNDSGTLEENFSSTSFTPGLLFNVAKVVQEKRDMKVRKNQKKELQTCLVMLEDEHRQRGNDVATEDEIAQHDQALRSGQHHAVRNVKLNQLIGDIKGKKEELTTLNLRDSDELGKVNKEDPKAIQLKDNG